MAPNLVSRLVLLAPSPRVLTAGIYEGNPTKVEIEEVRDAMEENYFGWSGEMAPVIAGELPEGPNSRWLTRSFCRTEPRIAQHFGRVTFTADTRADVAWRTPLALIVQGIDDTLAPRSPGEWMLANVAHATLDKVDTVGHCPHLAAPTEVINLIEGSFRDDGR